MAARRMRAGLPCLRTAGAIWNSSSAVRCSMSWARRLRCCSNRPGGAPKRSQGGTNRFFRSVRSTPDRNGRGCHRIRSILRAHSGPLRCDQYETPDVVTAVHREVHRKWVAILDVTPEQRRVQLAGSGSFPELGAGMADGALSFARRHDRGLLGGAHSRRRVPTRPR